MATKQTLIVVHGMGQHTDETVRAEVTAAFKAAFGLYDALKNKEPKDLFDIVPAVYNNIFDEYRAQVKEQSAALVDQLATIDPAAKHFDLDVVQKINDVETSIGKDSFFSTHWLDVVLYYVTLLCEPARLQVAEKIATAIGTVGSSNVHVLGHSLGTVVLHDTLAKAYGPDHLKTKAGKVLNLSTVQHRLASLHMVANVSRALQTFVNIDSSVVRPGPLGCTDLFMEYRHKLDPIPMIRPFNPTDNEGWVAHNIFAIEYQLLTPSSVTAANVHDLGHYIKIPAVHRPLFQLLFNFEPSNDEAATADETYFAETVLGKATALQTAFGDLHPGDSDSLLNLLNAAKALKDMVLGFKEKF